MNRGSERGKRISAALATAATGLVTIGGQVDEVALSGRHLRAGLPLLPLHALGIAGGLGLLVLAVGLSHGKRRAALVAIAALAVIGAANLAFGLSAARATIELGATPAIDVLHLVAFIGVGIAVWILAPAQARLAEPLAAAAPSRVPEVTA
jgi:hypothetical protein